jgi:hypothetical protein
MSTSVMSSGSPAPRARRRRPVAELVLGVDTHRDAHAAAVLSLMGTVLATDEFPATAAGYRDLLKWVRKLGVVGLAGVEGTGSFGASLSRYLLVQGVDVFDVNRMDRARQIGSARLTGSADSPGRSGMRTFVWPGSWNVMPRSCSTWWGSVRTRPSLC